MRERTASRGVDDQRFGPARNCDRRHARQRIALRRDVENLDAIRVGLGHPQLARRREVAHVIGIAAELRARSHASGSRIDDHDLFRGPVDRIQCAFSLIDRSRPFAVSSAVFLLAAQSRDHRALVRGRIDQHEIAHAAGRHEHAVQRGGIAKVVEADALLVGRDRDGLAAERLRAGGRRCKEQCHRARFRKSHHRHRPFFE
jgi:hypothetical protein